MTDKDIQQNNDDIQIRQGDVEADLAGEFLGKALRHSFFILKIIMGVLIVLFFTSGIFRVEENENALVLRFGKIQRTCEPGLQWTLPEPISEIVKIPVNKVQTVKINSFWYFETAAEKLGQKSSGGATLNPVTDGYCITRNDSVSDQSGTDYNIVHGEWQLSYRIDDIESFFRNIYYRAPKPGEDFLDVVSESVDPLLRAIAADAVVTTMVNYSIDEAIVNKAGITNDIKKRIVTKLKALDSGIEISAFEVSRKMTWPRQVDKEFQQANRASQMSQQAIIDARSFADELLSKAGGVNAVAILETLKRDNISDEDREYYLSQLAGTSRKKIADARAYRTTVVETARANADYLAAILPEFNRRPKLVIQEIYQDAVEEVFANADEKILIQPSANGQPRQIRVLLNRDKTINRTKSKDQGQDNQ